MENLQKKCHITGKKSLVYRGKSGRNADNDLKSTEKVPYYRGKVPGIQGKRWQKKYTYCFSCLRVRGGSLPSNKCLQFPGKWCPHKARRDRKSRCNSKHFLPWSKFTTAWYFKKSGQNTEMILSTLVLGMRLYLYDLCRPSREAPNARHRKQPKRAPSGSR